VTVNKLLVKYW